MDDPREDVELTAVRTVHAEDGRYLVSLPPEAVEASGVTPDDEVMVAHRPDGAVVLLPWAREDVTALFREDAGGDGPGAGGGESGGTDDTGDDAGRSAADGGDAGRSNRDGGNADRPGGTDDPDRSDADGEHSDPPAAGGDG